MSFIRAFHRLLVNLVDAERGVYADINLGLPQHEDEEDRFFYAKVIGFLHSYGEGLQVAPYDHLTYGASLFTRELESEQPLLGYIGELDRKTLARAQREFKPKDVVVYFFESEQVLSFANSLKVAKENWIQRVRFFKIDLNDLDQLIANHGSVKRWDVHRYEADVMVVMSGGVETNVGVVELDIWQEYQSVLQALDSRV